MVAREVGGARVDRTVLRLLRARRPEGVVYRQLRSVKQTNSWTQTVAAADAECNQIVVIIVVVVDVVVIAALFYIT